MYIGETRNCFLSTVHTDEDLDRLLLAVKDSVMELQKRKFLIDPSPNPPEDETAERHQLNGSLNGQQSSHTTSDARESIPPGSNVQDVYKEVRTLPLTEGQKELWYLAQVGDDSSRAYNETITLQMRGSLDLAAMRKAFQEIIDRHEALRTTFSLAGEYQRVFPTMMIDIPLVDFSSPEKADPEAQVQDWIAAETQRTFDLEKGPLLRAALIKLEEQHHFLVIAFHHIIVDGQSAGILLQELGALYSAECQGIACQLPQPMQYSEYARWQAHWMQSPEMAEAETYWLQQFENVDGALELSGDRPRPPIKTYKGAQEYMTINASLTSTLKSLSAQQNTTVFATLLATFKTLLYRLTDQRDIVVTIPMAEQLAINANHLVGHCVNLLPLRSQVVGDPAFTDYLHKVKHVLLDALHYHAYPFIKLVENLKLVRDPARTPLVTAAFNVDYPGELEFFNLEVNLAPGSTSFVKYDLFINVLQTDRELEIACDYNSDLFSAQTIRRWLGHWQTLLEGIMADPSCPISALPLLSEQQREQMLHGWNATASAYPRERSLSQLFEEQVERAPEAIAVVSEQEQLTYRELDVRANQLAHHLQQSGVGPEVLVGVALERGVPLVVALLGILKAGGAYLPLDPSYPVERQAFMLEQAQVPVLLTQQSLLEKLPATSSQLFCLERDWPLVASAPTTACPNEAGPHNLAYVIYTSGSTGQPKGVQVSQQAVVRLVCKTNYVQLQAADHVAQASNASFDAATFEIWGALLHGARLVGISKEVALSPTNLAAQLQEQAISTLFLTTALFNQVAQLQPQAFDGVRQVLFGGEKVEPQWVRAVLEQAGVGRVLHVYGPTENTTFSSWYEVREVAAQERTLPIGSPIANTQCYVVSRQGQLAPVGVVGELYVGGAGLARGYLSRPESTAEKFVPHPFSEQGGERLYRTGDLVRWLADGSLEFVGRQDGQVKLRGFRVELGEVEVVLSQHPALEKVVVLVREGESAEKRLIAYLVARGEQKPTSSELRRYLQEKLPDYMVPAVYVFLEAFPLTPNGKLDRQALPAPDGVRPELETAYVPPRTEVEEILAGIWADVLGLEHIGISDNFFEIGGNSLTATRTISRIRETFQVELSLRVLFEMPDIAGLASAIVQSESAQKDIKIQAAPRESIILDQLLMDLNQLSEHEAEAILTDEMERKRF
ncbi:MAG TPA: amino acid adenylation domain-containing protein [Ktedonobacteraceae bacterium]